MAYSSPFKDCTCECHFQEGWFHCFGPQCCSLPDVKKNTEAQQELDALIKKYET